MKLIYTLIFSTFFTLMEAQRTEFYTINSALKNSESARSLFINYNFSTIEDISESIGELTNLEEFRILGRMTEFPLVKEDEIVAQKIDDSSARSPYYLPHAIANCKELRILDLSNTDILMLPEDISSLERLETLILNNSKVNLDQEIEKIKVLPQLKEIEIVNVDVSERVKLILQSIEGLMIISDYEDFKKKYSVDGAVDIQIHDTYIVFKDRMEADRFINSMPQMLSRSVKIIEN